MAEIDINNGEKLLSINLSAGDDELFHSAPLPLDSEGFIVSFKVDQEEEILKFFEKHGVVVVSNVLTEEECRRSVKEVWLLLKELNNPEIDPEKPETWERGWPSLSKLGILGNIRWLYPQACDNRQNPNVYRVFQTLFGEHELFANVTRAGLMRPTRDIFFPTLNKTEDRPTWKTLSEWLHLDMNPLTGRCTTYGFENVAESHHKGCDDVKKAQDRPTNNGMRKRKLQGIIALDDCREQDGGFHAVPGFHHYIKTWTKNNERVCIKSNEGFDPTTVQIPEDDPIRDHIQRMPIRRGDLLVWDSRLPHGNYPNNSNKMRIVQYLHMAPVSDLAIRPYPLIADDLPTDFRLTNLGNCLYGFKPWPSTLAKNRFKEKRNQEFAKSVETERETRNLIKKHLSS